MMYEDYTIGGELYHAFNGRAALERGKRAVHKYIDKIMTKSGKWRYIYEDAKRQGNNARAAAYNKLKRAGITVRNKAKAASMIAQREGRNAAEAFNKTSAGKFVSNTRNYGANKAARQGYANDLTRTNNQISSSKAKGRQHLNNASNLLSQMNSTKQEINAQRARERSESNKRYPNSRKNAATARYKTVLNQSKYDTLRRSRDSEMSSYNDQLKKTSKLNSRAKLQKSLIDDYDRKLNNSAQGVVKSAVKKLKKKTKVRKVTKISGHGSGNIR